MLLICCQYVTRLLLQFFSKMKKKEPIHIRYKKLMNGNKSIYLDKYYNGIRSYEFLKLYLLPDTSQDNREANRQTMMLANQIKAKKIIELECSYHGFARREASDINLIDYLRIFKSIQPKEHSRAHVEHVIRHVETFCKTPIQIARIDKRWVNDFANYLRSAKSLRTGKELRQNTKAAYFAIFRSCMRKALADDVILTNPAASVMGIGMTETNRMYLTIEELRKLTVTPCKNSDVKRAFLFSALTGIRKCDIKAITWGDVYEQGEFTRVIFRQRKTAAVEYLDINEQAAQLMGVRGKPDEHIFTVHSAYNYYIGLWVKDAGINKNITFHSARHTFATMMLTLGTDIYTVSKLLGHRDIATTQVYAKILDEKKQKAVSLIPDIGV